MIKTYHKLFLLTLLSISQMSCSNRHPASSLSTDWSMWGGDYAGTRYSALDEINTSNVKKLKLVWAFPTKVPGGHEGGPLIVDDIVYIHTPFPNHVYAINQQSHQLIWQYIPQQDANKTIPHLCCGTINRGLAYANNTIFLQQTNTVLTALNAKTGQVIWQVKNGKPKQGMTNTNAPIVVKDTVITGISGGDFGVRGFLAAYDIHTGKLRWKGYSTGPDKDMLINPVKTTTWKNNKVQAVGRNSSLKTWKDTQWKIGGGTTWGWYSYDPELNLIYYGTGDPGTWNPIQRPGDNKWTSALWARNADTGEVKWVYQMTPHNEWDYDGTNELVLVDQKINGNLRKTLVHFDENGFVYTLDRETGELLQANKFDSTVNWATHIDIPSGLPQRVTKYSPQFHGEDNTTEGICPSIMGSKSQNPVSFSKKTKLFYIAGNHDCIAIEPFEVTYTAGQPFGGASISFDSNKKDKGFLSAWDAGRGKAVWRIQEPQQVLSGTLATAGNLVFYGTLDGYLKAVNAKTGQELFKFKTPSGIVGNINTWQYQGKQYIGVLSGLGGYIGFRQGINSSTSALSLFSVFALPNQSDTPTFLESYPVEFFKLNTKNNPKYEKKWQEKFNPDILSMEVHKLVAQIDMLDEVHDSIMGFGRSVQYDNYLALKKQASLAELLELTKHPSPAVRVYAFWALTAHPDIDLTSVLLDHSGDTSEVGYQSGCEVWSETVGDVMFKAINQNADHLLGHPQMSKIPPQAFKNIEKLLVLLNSPLDSASVALTHIDPLPQLYPKIRELLVKEHKQAALVALAKYQKDQDISLILTSSGKRNNAKEGFSYTYQAISHFPHPDFFPLLKQSFMSVSKNQKFRHGDMYGILGHFYKAIAAYQNKAALKLLTTPLQFTDGFLVKWAKKYHKRAVLAAITQYMDPIYTNLMWQLWEKDHQLSITVFNYLAKEFPEKTWRLLQKTLPSVINEANELIPYNALPADQRGVELVTTLFNYALQKSPAYAESVIINKIKNRGSYFDFFIQKAAELKSKRFIEPLLSQIDKKPFYSDLAMAKALFSYADPAINQRVLDKINQNALYEETEERIKFKAQLIKAVRKTQ